VFFGIVPKTLWAPRMPPDDQNRVPLAFNSYVVETGGLTILIETGGGVSFDDRARQRLKMPEHVSHVTEALSAEGIEPDRIDLVINTHLHWDHCSGNMLDGRPAFPNARYVTQRGEWEYAHTRHTRDSISYLDGNYDPLVKAGQMELLNGDAEVASGIEVMVAPGHNRDMMVVKARSRGQTFCMLADLVPSSHHLKPTWVSAFDLYPVTTMETRAAVLTEAAREGWWCGFGHDAKLAFATISPDYQLQETVA
jgi:glyoxylase-like metal-dependent hydrolase (beta-lactamase superfamily II)